MISPIGNKKITAAGRNKIYDGGGWGQTEPLDGRLMCRAAPMHIASSCPWPPIRL